MDKDIQNARESVKNMNFKEKLKYFWDYYKIHTIVTIVVIAMIIGTVISIATRERYDLEIVYFGSRTFDEGYITSLEEDLESRLKDADGNGEVNVNFIINTVDTSEDSQYLMAMEQKMNVDLAAATYHSYIVDEYFFEILNQDDVLEAYFDIANSTITYDIFKPDKKRPKEYWCTRALYESEINRNDEKNMIMHENAQIAHIYLESNVKN